MIKKIELILESILWGSRYIVILAVIASMITSAAMFYVATVDAFFLVTHLGEYASPTLDTLARAELRGVTITHVVEVIDGYLLAAVLLIFSLGLYELFISKIDSAENSETSSNVLLITSLDDLKARLAKVILMILIVRFFEYVISMHYATPLDTLYLAAGIALIGLSLYLSHAAEPKEKSDSH